MFASGIRYSLFILMSSGICFSMQNTGPIQNDKTANCADEQKETKLPLQDHILMPTGEYLRLLYNPAAKEAQIMHFDTNGLPKHGSTRFSDPLTIQSKLPFSKIHLRGLVPYNNRILYLLIAKQLRKNDTCYVGIANFNEKSIQCLWRKCDDNLRFVDVTLALTAKHEIILNAQTKIRAEKRNFQVYPVKINTGSFIKDKNE